MKPSLTRNQMFEKCRERYFTLRDPDHPLHGVVKRLIWPVRTSTNKAMLMAAWQIMEFMQS